MNEKQIEVELQYAHKKKNRPYKLRYRRNVATTSQQHSKDDS